MIDVFSVELVAKHSGVNNNVTYYAYYRGPDDTGTGECVVCGIPSCIILRRDFLGLNDPYWELDISLGTSPDYWDYYCTRCAHIETQLVVYYWGNSD